MAFKDNKKEPVDLSVSSDRHTDGHCDWMTESAQGGRFSENYFMMTGLIQVKEEGWTGFSKGWQRCSEGFPKGKVWGKSWGAALPAQRKPRPSPLFYLD